MSRIGRKPIPVPSGVDIKIDGQTVRVKGPKGELQHTVAEPITVERGEDGVLYVVAPQRRAPGQGAARPEPHAGGEHGRRRDRRLPQVAGDQRHRATGSQQKGADLEFALGFSHPVIVQAPDGITFTVERPTLFHIAGIDKQQVGEVAANIRKIRPPEPYKGKGVKYVGEVIRRKAGKAGKK